MNVVSEPFASNGCFSGFTVLALKKYAIMSSELAAYCVFKRFPFSSSLVQGMFLNHAINLRLLNNIFISYTVKSGVMKRNDSHYSSAY
jgi:hypothetical protein